MAAPKGNKFATGGVRPGSGRKPVATTILKKKINECTDEAQEAFDFCLKAMRDESWEKALRLAAAKEVMDRVLGKPKQQLEHAGEIQGRLILVRPGAS